MNFEESVDIIEKERVIPQEIPFIQKTPSFKEIEAAQKEAKQQLLKTQKGKIMSVDFERSLDKAQKTPSINELSSRHS